MWHSKEVLDAFQQINGIGWTATVKLINHDEERKTACHAGCSSGQLGQFCIELPYATVISGNFIREALQCFSPGIGRRCSRLAVNAQAESGAFHQLRAQARKLHYGITHGVQYPRPACLLHLMVNGGHQVDERIARRILLPGIEIDAGFLVS